MDITDEEIKAKKQELHIESAPSMSDSGEMAESLTRKMESEADLSERASQVGDQQFQNPPGTNQRNQYRYGGERP
jgi:hypothetical protein